MSLDLATQTSHFDRTVVLTETVDGDHGDGTRARSFLAELDPSWASLVGVHGGYMAALAVRAAEASAPGRVVRTISTSFLRPGAVGPATLAVDVVREGRTFSTLDVTLWQGERAVCASRVTMVVGSSSAGGEWSAPVTDRPAALDQCVSFTPPPGIRHFEQAELRIDPTTIPEGTASYARVAGHVRPLEDRPFDAAWLVMIGDWFPPSPFRRLTPPAGGISIDYTVHIHRVPPTVGWLEGVFQAPNRTGGIALEHGVLSRGIVVAETFHTRYTGA